MQLGQTSSASSDTRRLVVGLAETSADIRAAQRLRWKVFVEEQGARIQTPLAGHDIDALDSFCQHLIVKDATTGDIVGTYRLLTAEAARQAGGYYCANEFAMPHELLGRGRLLEIGRSCVLPGYRSGGTIALLWAGLAELLVASGHDTLIGCASIPLRPNRAAAVGLALKIAREHRVPGGVAAVPRHPFPAVECADETAIPVPPLLKGYLRSGALICGEPCWDPEFDCADLLVYLGIEQITSRYARRFLPKAEAPPRPAAFDVHCGIDGITRSAN